MNRLLATMAFVLGWPGAALAQTAPAAQSAPPPAAQSPAPEVGAGEPDAARLAAAARTVAAIFPAGAYARMMRKTMDGAVKPMVDGMGQMRLRDLALLGGLDGHAAAQIGDASLREIMAIYDPAYPTRTARTIAAMTDEMTKMTGEFEPVVREALRKAYARRYSAAQLGEINAFFATPTGRVYAENSLLIFSDPDVLAAMQQLMPLMMQRMPAIAEHARAATADLPKPRGYRDLSPAERTRLAQLLGISERELEANSRKLPARD